MSPIQESKPVIDGINVDEYSRQNSEELDLAPLRTRLTREVIEHSFENVDLQELAQITSVFTNAQSRATTTTSRPGLPRQDTVAGMAFESAEFDPNHKSFNFFLWARSMVLPQHDG